MTSSSPGRGAPLPMFPLSNVLFPHAPLRLHVFEPRYRQMTADCLSGEREMGIVLITRGSEVGGNDQRARVATVAHIEDTMPMPDGRWFLLLSGRRRVSVGEWLVDDPYPRAFVDELPDGDSGGGLDSPDGPDGGVPDGGVPDGGVPGVDAGAVSTGAVEGQPGLAGPGAEVLRAFSVVRQLWGLMSEAGQAPPLPVTPEDLAADPEVAAWQLCQLTPVGALDRQRLLETRSMADRLDLVVRLSTELAGDVGLLLAGG